MSLTHVADPSHHPICMEHNALRRGARGATGKAKRHATRLLLLLGGFAAAGGLISGAKGAGSFGFVASPAIAQPSLAASRHVLSTAPRPYAAAQRRTSGPSHAASGAAPAGRTLPAGPLPHLRAPVSGSVPVTCGVLSGLAMAAAAAAGLLRVRAREAGAAPHPSRLCSVGPAAAALPSDPPSFETVVPPGVQGREGVYCARGSPLANRVLRKAAALARWSHWYEAPLWARNGHVHTIVASTARRAVVVEYHRTELATPDGGTLALDRLIAVRAEERSGADDGVRFVGPASAEWEGRSRRKPFLLLTSGLGGGSHDAYVRSMASAAAGRGWQVAILNMRSCGGSPVTSPRFFSACRGSTCDVRFVVAYVRERFVAPGSSIAVMGWSNGGSIVNNLLAEQATTHLGKEHRVDAGVALATPLDMVAANKAFKRWFNRNVYDRAIARNLVQNLRDAQHLFDGEVDTWGGDTCTIDVQAALQCTTIEGLDEEVTRKSFGFESVDEYYRHASSSQRLEHVSVPLLIVNAIDDPIAPGHSIPWQAPRDNENLLIAVTKHGGHLGWCDRSSPFDGCGWVEDASLSFLGAALNHGS